MNILDANLRLAIEQVNIEARSSIHQNYKPVLNLLLQNKALIPQFIEWLNYSNWPKYLSETTDRILTKLETADLDPTTMKVVDAYVSRFSEPARDSDPSFWCDCELRNERISGIILFLKTHKNISIDLLNKLFHKALQNSHEPLIPLIMQCCPVEERHKLYSANAVGRPPLDMAVYSSDPELIKDIYRYCPRECEKDLFKDYYNNTPLSIAVNQGTPDIIKALIEYCPPQHLHLLYQKNRYNCSALHRGAYIITSAKQGNIKSLLENTPERFKESLFDADACGSSAIMWIARHETDQYLLEEMIEYAPNSIKSKLIYDALKINYEKDCRQKWVMLMQKGICSEVRGEFIRMFKNKQATFERNMWRICHPHHVTMGLGYDLSQVDTDEGLIAVEVKIASAFLQYKDNNLDPLLKLFLCSDKKEMYLKEIYKYPNLMFYLLNENPSIIDNLSLESKKAFLVFLSPKIIKEYVDSIPSRNITSLIHETVTVERNAVLNYSVLGELISNNGLMDRPVIQMPLVEALKCIKSERVDQIRWGNGSNLLIQEVQIFLDGIPHINLAAVARYDENLVLPYIKIISDIQAKCIIPFLSNDAIAKLITDVLKETPKHVWLLSFATLKQKKHYLQIGGLDWRFYPYPHLRIALDKIQKMETGPSRDEKIDSLQKEVTEASHQVQMVPARKNEIKQLARVLTEPEIEAEVKQQKEQSLEALEKHLKEFSDLRKAAMALKKSNEENIPDHFIDPITAEMMSDPVNLKGSTLVVDRTTIPKLNGINPVTRGLLRAEDVVSNDELKIELLNWRIQHSTDPLDIEFMKREIELKKTLLQYKGRTLSMEEMFTLQKALNDLNTLLNKLGHRDA